jgi:hypothetical protein
MSLDLIHELVKDRRTMIDALSLIYNTHDIPDETYQLIEVTLERVTSTKPATKNETKP